MKSILIITGAGRRYMSLDMEYLVRQVSQIKEALFKGGAPALLGGVRRGPCLQPCLISYEFLYISHMFEAFLLLLRNM